jgi:hypothetical protein
VDRPGEFDHGWCPSRVLDPRQTSSLANHDNNIDNNNNNSSIAPYSHGPSPIDCENSHERFFVTNTSIHHQIIIINNTILILILINDDDDDDDDAI